ncbi:MAG: AMP-binding protein, partial [Burkholderiales bacterium]
MAVVALDTLDTFPRLLLSHATTRGDRPAIREKDLGIWQTWSWSQVADEVALLAQGLASLGFVRGMNLAIIGSNRPRLYWAMTAAQALGGVPVPLYQDAVAAEMVFVVQNAEIEFAIVEDQEQVDKLLEILPQCPGLKHVLYDDGRGLRHYAQPPLLSYERLRELGREFGAAHPGFFAAEVALGSTDEVSVILYTSGTTGDPKGVCLTHRACLAMSFADCEFDGLTDRDDIVSYLPMAWVGDHLLSYGQAYAAGFCINCPESSETVLTDMREIGPTYFFAPPRVFENILTQVS